MITERLIAESSPALKEVWHRMRLAAKAAYRRAAREHDVDESHVHFDRLCEDVTETMFEHLSKRYPSQFKMLRYQQGLDAGIVSQHQFLVLEDDVTWVVDPTWQQFLPGPDPTRPKILRTPLSMLERTLTTYGVPQEFHCIWTEAVPIADTEAAR
jgi:hypothetical protein